MDITKFIRDASKINACLTTLKDGSVVCSKRMYIYIPARFAERQLASISTEVYIVGLYAIAIEDGFYAVSNVNAMLRITPSAIKMVKVSGDEYFEFVFEAGSTVFTNLNLVKNDTLTYYIFDEFLSKGRIPWYFTYDDLGGLFDTAAKHAGARVGNDKVVIDIIASIIARNPDDRYDSYRHMVKSRDDLIRKPPVFVPLNAIQYTATNTVAKLAGAYMSDGVVSALVNPSERAEHIETLLTS